MKTTPESQLRASLNYYHKNSEEIIKNKRGRILSITFPDVEKALKFRKFIESKNFANLSAFCEDYLRLNGLTWEDINI